MKIEALFVRKRKGFDNGALVPVQNLVLDEIAVLGPWERTTDFCIEPGLETPYMQTNGMVVFIDAIGSNLGGHGIVLVRFIGDMPMIDKKFHVCISEYTGMFF